MKGTAFTGTRIDPGANYEPNSISGNWPREVPPRRSTADFQSVRGLWREQKSGSAANPSGNISRSRVCSG